MAELTNAAVVPLNPRASCCEVFAESFRRLFRACCRIDGMIVGDRQQRIGHVHRLRDRSSAPIHLLYLSQSSRKLRVGQTARGEPSQSPRVLEITRLRSDLLAAFGTRRLDLLG